MSPRARGRTRRSFLGTLGLVGLAGGGAWLAREHLFWPGPRIAWPEEGRSPWLPFAAPGRLLVSTEARIGGTPVNALVDSGAQGSILDASLARELDLPGRLAPPQIAFGLGGGAQLSRAVAADVRLGDLELAGLTAGVLNLGPLAGAALGTRLIIGQDVLSRAVLEIDFPNRRLRLTDPEGWSPPPDAIEIPARRAGRALMTDVVIEGAAFEALVDTGASPAVSIRADHARAAGLLDGRPARASASIVLGGMLEGQVVAARALTIGGRPYEDVEVHVYPPGALPGGSPLLAGMAPFLDARLVLNIPEGRLFTA